MEHHGRLDLPAGVDIEIEIHAARQREDARPRASHAERSSGELHI
jgi:hypothetical protein